jgi:hypothetical protein
VWEENEKRGGMRLEGTNDEQRRDGEMEKCVD